VEWTGVLGVERLPHRESEERTINIIAKTEKKTELKTVRSKGIAHFALYYLTAEVRACRVPGMPTVKPNHPINKLLGGWGGTPPHNTKNK